MENFTWYMYIHKLSKKTKHNIALLTLSIMIGQYLPYFILNLHFYIGTTIMKQIYVKPILLQIYMKKSLNNLYKIALVTGVKQLIQHFRNRSTLWCIRLKSCGILLFNPFQLRQIPLAKCWNSYLTAKFTSEILSKY